MTEQLSVADVLERAADYLTAPGAWSGGGQEPTGADCLCTALAIDEVAGGLGHPDGNAAREFFAKVLGVSNHTVAIYDWNDFPGRTQSEVVAKLREAATRARTPADA